MKGKLSKEDKKFLLTTSIYNRDFFLNINSIRISMVVAVTAVVASIFSILLTIHIINPLYLGIGSVVVTVAIWLDWYVANKRIRKRITNLQRQYREYLTDVYPELKDSDFYY